MARKFKKPERVNDYEREEKIDFHKVIFDQAKWVDVFFRLKTVSHWNSFKIFTTLLSKEERM